jgi:hypothetical protein
VKRVLSRQLTNESSKLYVVTSISNPCRYKSRYELYKSFKDYIDKSEATLITIELAHGNRSFEVSESESLTNIQVRGDSDLWVKENLLNIAMQFLPTDWEYVAFIDADIRFVREDWANETIQLLQHYDVIQMFSQAQDLGPNNEVIKSHKGFVKAYYDNDMKAKCSDDYGYSKYFGHPGYTIAARRKALDDLGGLIDFSILGAGDNHFFHSLVGEVDKTIPASLLDTGYGRELMEYQGRADLHIKRNIGYMPGTLLHSWHGRKKDRRYQDRWKILTKNQFDPDTDIYKETQGLYRLSGNKPRLRDEIRQYFASRNEDSIDV